MGNTCAVLRTKKEPQFGVEDTNHGSGWGVPPVKKQQPQEAEAKPAEVEPQVVVSDAEKPKETAAETAQEQPEARRKSSARPKSESKDLNKLKDAIIQAMKVESHDDGSLGPTFIRLAWHSCATYDKTSNTGGSGAGATMRFSPESEDPDNAGLHIPREALAKVQAQFPWISHSDLWILAGTIAIKELGGPEIEVKFGRKDHPGPTSPIEIGRLPKPEVEENKEGLEEDGSNRLKGWEKLGKHMRGVFERLGFNEQEMVVLICGGHVFGRTHAQFSGYQGAWVENPLEFSNEFAADLVGDEWRYVDGSNEQDQKEIPPAVCPAHGKKQYVSKPFDEHPQMMLPSDMVLLWDDALREHTKRYADDEELLRKDFAAAWKKLIELGCEGLVDKP